MDKILSVLYKIEELSKKIFIIGNLVAGALIIISVAILYISPNVYSDYFARLLAAEFAFNAGLIVFISMIFSLMVDYIIKIERKA